MSGLEVFGAAASLISVVGGLKTCIDLLDIISSARGADVELEDLFVHFQWQRIRFYCWVQETGFSEAIIQHDERRPPEAPEMLASLPHELRREFILSHIQRSVANMNARLQAAKPTLERYFSRRESATNAAWRERLDRFLDPHTALRIVPAREPEATQVKFGLWARLRWVSRDEKELSQLVDTLRKYNAELAGLLPLYRVARFERRIGRVLVTTRQLAAGIAAIGLGGNSTAGDEIDDGGVQQYRRIARLLESRHETDVLEGAASSLDPADETSGSLRAPVSQASLYLRASEFKFKKQEGGVLRTREFASWQTSPVMIEWRYYSTKETRMTLAGVDARVHMLAMQLQQLSALDGTGVLVCLEHFCDEKRHRYGIVFRYPNGRSAASPVSLGDRLRQDQPLRIRRDLEDRFRIARGLIKTVYQMLSVNWVHKGISSANILLFDENEVDSLSSEGRVYLCGFDFARRDTNIEMSEKLPSVYQNSCPSLDERLYWHPDRNLAYGCLPNNADESTHLTPRYRREFDIYSLGVVLLEIGLWCPAQRLLKDCRTEDLTVFAEELRKTYVPELRGRMGRVYAEIVTCCLEGRFGQDSSHPSGNEAESELDDEEELHRRRFLEDLERKVVCTIENPLGF